MTEVIHYKNRFGKQMVVVDEVDQPHRSPEGNRYARRYAAGEIKPYYWLPAIPYVAIICHDAVDLFDNKGYIDSWMGETHD